MKIEINNFFSKVNFYCDNSQYYVGFCDTGINRLINSKSEYKLRYNALSYSFNNCLNDIINSVVNDIEYHDITFFELEFKDIQLFKEKIINELEKFIPKNLGKRYINKIEKEYNSYNVEDIDHDMILILEIELYFNVKGT